MPYRSQTQRIDPRVASSTQGKFLATVGAGKQVLSFAKRQTIFTQVRTRLTPSSTFRKKQELDSQSYPSPARKLPLTY